MKPTSFPPGPTSNMPVSPLIMGLLGTAGVLAAGVCLVLAALCRRHYHARPPYLRRGDDAGAAATKHVPMEAVIGEDAAAAADGQVTTGVRTPLAPLAASLAPEAYRNGAAAEGTDPDIIRNQYGEWAAGSDERGIRSQGRCDCVGSQRSSKHPFLVDEDEKGCLYFVFKCASFLGDGSFATEKYFAISKYRKHVVSSAFFVT